MHAWTISGEKNWIVIQCNPSKVLNMVSLKVLEPVDGGKDSVNPFPNPSCPQSVIAPSESRS